MKAVIDLCQRILKYAVLARQDLGDGKGPLKAAMEDGKKDAETTRNTEPPKGTATGDAKMDTGTTKPPVSSGRIRWYSQK